MQVSCHIADRTDLNKSAGLFSANSTPIPSGITPSFVNDPQRKRTS